MTSHPPTHSLDQNHITLDIKPSLSSSEKPSKSHPTKIIRFSRDQTLHQAIKERSRTFHSLSLNYQSLDAYYIQADRVIVNLKQLKSVQYLTIDLRWLANIHKDADRLFESLKHFKNLKVLHFQASEIYTVIHGPNLNSLCQSIRKINHLVRAEIRLSLSVFKYVLPDQLKKLLTAFTKLKRLSSTQLSFFNFDLAHIQQSIVTLKDCKPLNKLEVTIEQCELGAPDRLQNLLVSIKDVKALKDSKICLKKCNDVTFIRVKELLPAMKEVTDVVNLEVMFEQCGSDITYFQRRAFSKAIKGIGRNSEHKIRAEFVSDQQRRKVSLTTILCFGIPLIFFCLIPLFIIKIIQAIP